jgi:hypothetical protein
MFIHPRDSHGTVVQIAQAGWKPRPMEEWLAGLPDTEQHWGDGTPWWDRSVMVESGQTFDLVRLVIATPDLARAADFYGGLLGGALSDHDGVVDCRWPDGAIRLEPSGSPRPSVSRLEVAGPGWTEAEIGGVRFVSAG